MKHLPKILFLALLCIACRDEHDVPTHDFTIGFKAGVENTRAVVTGIEPLKDGFSVWGGFDGTTVFDGRKVYWGTDSEGNTGWMYDNPEVWVWNKDYTFYALYPDTSKRVYNVYSINQSYYIAYNVKEKQEDLLYAKTANNRYDGIGEPPVVGLNFEHTLVQLEFVGSSTAEQQFAFISGIKLYGEGLQSNGSFDISNAQWLSLTAPTTEENPYIYTDNASQGWRLSHSGTTVLSELLVFPKASGTNVTVSISLDGETRTTTLSDAWEAGKRYRYTFSIDPYDYIIFNKPIVTEWQTATAGSLVIK